MANFSKHSYELMFDQLLSQALCYEASAATESNIKRAVKRVLGWAIKDGFIKSYAGLVLDESLDVHFAIIDPTGDKFDLILYYGK